MSSKSQHKGRVKAGNTVLQKENEIRFKSYEHGAFFDSNGKILLEKKGRTDYVGFDLTDEDVSRLRGSTFTHNQPPREKLDFSGCVHLGRDVLSARRCSAFPEGIPPVAIWTGGNDHRQPPAGDHGIRFEPVTKGKVA